MLKTLDIAIFGFLLLIPLFPAQAFTGSEVSINNNGNTVISGARVMQVAGQTYFTRLYWGEAFVRLTVKGTSKTKVLRDTGEVTVLAEIKEGDMLNLVGQLESGGNTLTLIADQIKNTSVQKMSTVLSGKVAGIDLSANRFTLDSKTRGLVYVAATGSTKFLKGSRVIDLGRLKVNDKILSTAGEYDYKNNTLTAGTVKIYFDFETLKPKVYEGTLESISGTSLPTSLNVIIGKASYKILLSATTTILNKEKITSSLPRFQVKDKIRIYGSLREVDELIIDAEVVRNVSI